MADDYVSFEEATDHEPGLDIVSFGSFARENLPRREMILTPILPVQGLAMLFAGRGVGKTRVAMGMSWAAVTATRFLRWSAASPRRVLYVDGEMPQTAMQDRTNHLMSGSGPQPPDDSYFRLLSMDRQELGTSLNLALPEHQARLEAALGGTELLVLDNISTLVNGGRENDADSWDAMQAWLLQLRRKGLSVLLVAHAGRNDNARGTSKREDILDAVVHLKHPGDYEPEQGARFEVHYTKARGIFGEDALPFEARLSVENGQDHWTCQIIRDRELDQVEELSREGVSVRNIAEELDLSKSAVGRMQNKLRAAGRL
jgi:hypothetical protein